MNHTIRPPRPDEPIPNDLLLLADENQSLIDAYLPNSELYVVEVAGQVVGVGVLQVTVSMGEIMNIDLNYFLRTYPDPIWENGIQCKHRLIFQHTLKPDSI